MRAIPIRRYSDRNYFNLIIFLVRLVQLEQQCDLDFGKHCSDELTLRARLIR
jgi:hypothetical protein